jgi:hypothetical protein
MASNQSNWLWDANVFGPQAPAHNPAPTPGIYPECGRQQARNWALENMLYGLENVISPTITAVLTSLNQIYNNSLLQTQNGNIATVTDKLQLAAGSNSLPNTKLNTFITNISVNYQVDGYCIKASLYNPTANSSMTVINNSTEGFLLEAGVALDLELASNANIVGSEEVSNISITGTTAQTVYIVYSVLCIAQI